MHKLLLLLPLLLLPLLLLYTPVEAAACTYDALLEDDSIIIGGTTVGVEIDPATKPATGNTMYNDATVTVCIEEDDGGDVDIDWVDLDGNVLQTDVNVATNTDVTLSIVNINGYVGPIQFTIRPDAGGTGDTDFFFFLAPPPPTDAVNCTAGPDNRCLDLDPLPSFALGGQVYNQYFNSALQTLVDADVTAPKNSYFPNPVYLKYDKAQEVGVVGVFSDDVTYATDEYLTGQWVILYWWLTAGVEGFPAWTVTFNNDVRTITGDAINLNTLVAAQDRTFTTGTDYYGYVVLVPDRAVADFTAKGWFDQIDTSIVGTPVDFIGVWRPVHSGTYSNASKSLPTKLNGGYLSLVAEPEDTMLVLDMEVDPKPITSGTGLLWEGDSIISGKVHFHPGTNAGFVDYVAELLDDRGQTLQTLFTANCDGLTIVDVSFAFFQTTPMTTAKVLFRELDDPNYPAKVVDLVYDDISSILVPPESGAGLETYLTSTSVSTSALRQAFIGFGPAWGLSVGVGGVIISLVATGVLMLVTLYFIRIPAVGIFSAFTSLMFFGLLGVIPVTWFLLIMFAIIVGISWKLFGATA